MSLEDISSKIPKYGKKERIKFFAIMFIPPLTPILILMLLIPIDVKPFVNEYIPNYKVLTAYIPTGIQIMMGSVVVISVFYLGKVHDYRKELIINHVKFILILKNEKNEKKKELIKYFQNAFTDLLKIHGSAKTTIITSVIIMLFIFSILLINTISKTEPNEDYFVVMSLVLASLIMTFLVTWYLFEDIMTLSESILTLLLTSQHVLASNSIN